MVVGLRESLSGYVGGYAYDMVCLQGRVDVPWHTTCDVTVQAAAVYFPVVQVLHISQPIAFCVVEYVDPETHAGHIVFEVGVQAVVISKNVPASHCKHGVQDRASDPVLKVPEGQALHVLSVVLVQFEVTYFPGVQVVHD